jgi:hypothetical protein
VLGRNSIFFFYLDNFRTFADDWRAAFVSSDSISIVAYNAGFGFNLRCRIALSCMARGLIESSRRIPPAVKECFKPTGPIGRMSITTRPLFVAGEATTMPYKQIVIAMGDGAKPERSAFDHSIRLTPPSMLNAA